ncbi:Hypothetical protein FKW44_017283, partial [Caligus rogercresseyi]
EAALLYGIFTFHDLRSDSPFGRGRFRFHLQRSLKPICSSMPWFSKLIFDKQTSNEVRNNRVFKSCKSSFVMGKNNLKFN